MSRRIRCHCHGNARCQLCHGEKFYTYEPGERGWMPFLCPTCKGARVLVNGETSETCFTCDRVGTIDPAKPPIAPSWQGAFRIAWKILFGGG